MKFWFDERPYVQKALAVLSMHDLNAMKFAVTLAIFPIASNRVEDSDVNIFSAQIFQQCGLS